jgi:hypothetical protein
MLPQNHELPPLVWVAPDSPGLKGLDKEKDIYLVSALGRLKIRLKELPGLHPEAVLYRRGDWMKRGGGANQLIAARLTDMGNGAPFYDQYVKLENI